VEARSSDLYTQTGEGSTTAIVFRARLVNYLKIILARILHDVNVRGLMRDEKLGFRPKHSTSLQLVRLTERVTRNFGENKLTGAVSLDVAKASDTVLIDGLLYKLTLLNFPSYIDHTFSSYLWGRSF
jgi:hypothetical protein